MRRLLVIPGLLFGLLFAAGGYFIFAETALPMWQNWHRMEDWRPVNARLLSISAADNETRASYSYDFAGKSYQGNRVGVSAFKDNIGSYHEDMQAYLQRIQVNDAFLPIWVNPENPSQAVIDPSMRWGLFALTGAFCSIFMLIGLGVIYASLRSSRTTTARRGPSLWKMRATWQKAKNDGTTELEFLEFCQQHYADPRKPGASTEDKVSAVEWQSRKGWESPRIKSDAGKGVWFFWLFAFVWNAISTPIVFIVPAELRKQDSDAARHAIASGKFDIEGLSRAMRFRNEGNRIQLSFPMFRSRFLTLFAAIFAGGFGFASYSIASMASGGGLFGIIIIVFGIPFFLVALVAAIATIYLPLNNLKVEIESGEVSVLRRLLFIPVYWRRLRRDEISHLSIRRSGSTGQGVDKIEHYKIRAEDKQGKKLTLAEDIDGEDVAMHLRDYLAQRIGVATR
ncbi:MAG: DUF3592 domain-containing protein [Gammaproteobacteria bacterium]|nr:DUF3592 domain-containing protein [Gammaproteobacteria bacterium]